MGILLTFMFLWNMIGALLLIPALSHFLLRGIGQPMKGSEMGDLLPKTSMTPTAGESSTDRDPLKVVSQAVTTAR